MVDGLPRAYRLQSQNMCSASKVHRISPAIKKDGNWFVFSQRTLMWTASKFFTALYVKAKMLCLDKHCLFVYNSLIETVFNIGLSNNTALWWPAPNWLNVGQILLVRFFHVLALCSKVACRDGPTLNLAPF